MSDVITPALDSPLGWWARRRVNRIDVKLAGLKAKLEATNNTLLFVANGSMIPGSLIYDLRNLPLLIAELEEAKLQIVRPNAYQRNPLQLW